MINEQNRGDFNNLELSHGIYDVQLITSYIISSSANLNLPMDLERSQRILYYIQAKYLYKNDQAIFGEDILAYENGPFIVESVDWLNKNIYEFDKYISNFTFIGYQDDLIRNQDKRFIDEILKTFQDMSTLSLSKKIKEESPWILTYKEGENNIISKKLILDYFKSNQKNAARLYGIYNDLDETEIVTELNKDPRVDHFYGKYPKKKFQSYIENSLLSSGLKNTDFHPLNDVLGYVCDFLVYKEISITLNEIQAILYFIQKSFLKFLNKICFNEFIFKNDISVSIGELADLYEIEKEEYNAEIAIEREYNYTSLQREYISDNVKELLIDKKANPYAKENFTKKELEVMDTVLNELIKYPGFHILNLIQNEEAWIKTNLKETITIRDIYEY